MTLPAPTPGLVIRFSFLWSHEQQAGAEEAAKDRPCAIVVAARMTPEGEIETIVAPITHSAPADIEESLEIPRPVCRALGLDDGRHWLRLDELNRFAWPGFDLRPIPGKAGDYAYGMLPRDLFDRLRAGILKRQAARRVRVQRR